MHRQKIDEGGGRIYAVGAARTEDRTESLREPDETEIADVDLFARHRQPVTIDDTAGAHMFRGINNDVDTRAVLLGLLGDGFGVCQIQRHDLDALDLAPRIEARKRLPRIGNADKDNG